MRTQLLPLVSRLATALVTVPPVERTFALPAYACLQVEVGSGARLFCLTGKLNVRSPAQWLGASLLISSQTLAEGMSHESIQAGSMTLQAGRGGARVLLLAPLTGVPRLVASVRAAARALRQSSRKQAAQRGWVPAPLNDR